ncbi:MAG: glucosidase [Simkania sp.]|nr:glucosidase [Simkania sp.]
MKARETEEYKRLSKNWEEPFSAWNKWGTYVSERAWGTVREDYSADGDPWLYFPHDLAVKKVYRWGDDGIAGWCDRYQVLLFAPVFWNGVDPILKERLFGLSTHEGNHGEDVKECYYHLDATPSNSYMKYLYRYPQKKFPYELLVQENKKRTANDPEFEIYDTDIFNEGRYFDISIEYAKTTPEDVCIRITIDNHGPDPAPLHVIPHLWFRNQWSWADQYLSRPCIMKKDRSEEGLCLLADDTEMASPESLAFDYHLGLRYLYGPQGGESLFTDNETEYPNSLHPSETAFFKDGFHRAIIHQENTVNPEGKGTKACLHYFFPAIKPGEPVILDLRLSDQLLDRPLDAVPTVVQLRRKEADEFYASLPPQGISKELQQIKRQAFSGLIWNKQIYLYDVNLWLNGDNTYFPPPSSRNYIRNIHWKHLNSMRILSMPDKWEYPWFAAWDLAFQAVAFGSIDIAFAKHQLWLLLFDQFQHPSGQIPAYEWEFSDLNPPVQAWAVYHLYQEEGILEGKKDREFLEKCFHKLLMNFAWWVNKVDSSGNNVFEGGFLGLDNIAIFDRSMEFSNDARLQQSDGTGWMAMFSLNMMSIALELAKENSVYESLATKFFQHFAYIAAAIKKRGNQDYELWSEKDGFFYDVLTYPDGHFAKFRVRSMVGIIPLFACSTYEEKDLEALPEFYGNFRWFVEHRKELVEGCMTFRQSPQGRKVLFMPMNEKQCKRVLHHLWNPEEFRSAYGLRSLSKFHEQHPFTFGGKTLGYEPAESHFRVKGGNSNWRGPIWMQMNYFLLELLRRLERFYGHDYNISAPGEPVVSLEEMYHSFSQRLISLFDKNEQGLRPCLGQRPCFMKDPRFQEHIFFYEYFNPETGEGLGAAHQTGWTALITNVIEEFLC